MDAMPISQGCCYRQHTTKAASPHAFPLLGAVLWVTLSLSLHRSCCFVSLTIFFKDLCFYLSTMDKDLHSRKTDYFNLNHIFLYSYCFNKSKSYFCTINHFREIRESGTKGHVSSARSQYRPETSCDPKSTENHFKIDTTVFSTCLRNVTRSPVV